MRSDDRTYHQREDEEDQTNHATPSVADASRNEHKAPEQV